jgi:micrococcal nuclease
MGIFPVPLFFWSLSMHEYKAKVVKIIDGDTIDVDIDVGFDIIIAKQRIRLYGIDTPESRTRDKEEKFYGNISKQFLNDYCPKGSFITLRTHLDKKGKFGRILGEIIVNKVNLNEQMIEENLAVAYHGQSKMDIEKEHLYNRTQLNRRGINYS